MKMPVRACRFRTRDCPRERHIFNKEVEGTRRQLRRAKLSRVAYGEGARRRHRRAVIRGIASSPVPLAFCERAEGVAEARRGGLHVGRHDTHVRRAPAQVHDRLARGAIHVQAVHTKAEGKAKRYYSNERLTSCAL